MRYQSPSFWPGYSPARLIDTLKEIFRLKRDCDLAKRLGISRALLCKYRSGALPIRASAILRMHEESGLSTMELRRLMGDRRRYFRQGLQMPMPAKQKEAIQQV